MVIALVFASGCLQPNATDCAGGGVCPAGFRCMLIDEVQFCVPPKCGNGDKDPGEDCDDGNHVNGDGCLASCVVEECGDSFRVGLEDCDDGNRRSHDGCSSTCVAETPTWTSLSRDPSPRVGAAMAYDPARGITLMFGGCDISATPCTPLGDTWEWDGGSWIERTTASDPSARYGHAMTFRSDDDSILLFGGCVDVTHCSNDLWRWDGARWSSIPGSHAPPRGFHAMAYHPKEHRLYVHGGTVPAGGEMWTWDGSNWTQVNASFGPGERRAHSMTYDPVRNELVLFGGSAIDGPANDIWRWDGFAWHPSVHPAITLRPPPRHGHAMLAVPGHRVLVIGGCESPFDFNDPLRCDNPLSDAWDFDFDYLVAADTWQRLPALPSARTLSSVALDSFARPFVFGGSPSSTSLVFEATWREVSPSAKPRPQELTHLAYDANRGAVVMVGDAPSSEATWEWNGAWTARTTISGPSARRDAAVVYDPDRRASLLFGGGGDQWSWDGIEWLHLMPPAPPLDAPDASATYDTNHGVVLFARGAPWRWDGSSWHEIRGVPDGVAPRSGGLAHDWRRARTILLDTNTPSNVIELDAQQQWQTIHPPVALDPRSQFAFAFDPLRAVAILHGGRVGNGSATNETWSWDGVEWKLVATDGDLGPRAHHAMTYQTTRQRFVMFGGTTAAGALTDETWALELRSASPIDACNGFDGDLDGLVGCEDPDCAGYCDPFCATFGSCTQGSWPRCGDGTCSEIESCRLCPNDCGPCTPICGDFFCDPGEACLGDC